MKSWGHSLCMVWCLWEVVIGSTLQNVGPCVVSTKEVLFNCSQQMLAAIPDQVWDNVTVLDISQNQLNLIHPKTLWELRRFRQLVKLNLSGNYLPLLEKDTLGIHPLLQVLDLSRCQLAGIEVGALQAFPKLQALFLGNNQLQDPLPVALKEPNTLAFLDLFGNSRLKTNPPYWLKIKSVLWPAESDGRESRDISQEAAEQNISKFMPLKRKLLARVEEESTRAGNNETDVNRNQSSKTWPYLVAVLVTAIFTSISIALAAKCKLLHRYLASYRHTLLREGDTCSQGVPAGHEMNPPSLDAARQGTDATVCEEPDDDGFIEDNYIQASEKERAERAAEELDDEGEVIDVHFSIG
ncbi:type III endosome membrane protein TEMP [Scleropages formosus]|uniref:type III endosome membrane protein TEMP n=1 Tax=Scleropages formosus TaxID=113540 RepID=UPI0010FA6564|nr:type III endosome membrane protein TEMP [Scleropages formosus]